MDLHGSITENLRAAIASATRLQGHPVYGETLTYWRELIHEVRRRRGALPDSDRPALDALFARLEAELAGRAS
ncbi:MULTISPECIES: hypothetical protein [unclassified Sphingomonas]|uniref:hypothetical protein n=1 Tax=unclassified Sphingomonas TaxID=196159 RepID=UPI0006FD356E|nr:MULTISPECIES: hypothetical protein [unclassified Sphingomonas]KRB78791.1 hypothetical protein ASE00_21420 [Sphingomonas sp. Root710]KRB93701.1 hypothetical protein ASE22_25190 [Sphingomonas sp. Root720]